MTQQIGSALKELQRIDLEISEARDRIASFEPMLDEVEEPALRLESDVGTTRSRLQEMRLEERRLEVTSQEKRSRVNRLEERLNQVRNVREEAAVRAELEMVRRALEGDESEALSMLDQIRKLELKLEEQESALDQARTEVEPRREELRGRQNEAEEALEALEARRRAFTESMDDDELRVYEAIRAGGRRRAVSSLTADGACGHCFSMIPLQVQNEVRHGGSLIRCEACGVILVPPTSEEEAEGEAGEPRPAEVDDGSAEAPIGDGGDAKSAEHTPRDDEAPGA